MLPPCHHNLTMLQRSVLRLLLTGSKSVLGSALAPAASTANSEPPKSLSSSLVLSFCSFSSEALPAASQHGDRHIQQATDPGASSAGPVNDAAQAIDKDQGPVVIQDGPEVERFPFVPPHLRQQQPLHVDDAKLVWQYAQRMHGAGRLSQVRVGAAGLTRALLRHIMQLLQRNEVVRVTVSDRSQLDSTRDGAVGLAAFVLENCLDCAIVARRGRTLTLFREQSLALPPLMGPSIQDTHETQTQGIQLHAVTQAKEDVQGADTGMPLVHTRTLVPNAACIAAEASCSLPKEQVT